VKRVLTACVSFRQPTVKRVMDSSPSPCTTLLSVAGFSLFLLLFHTREREEGRRNLTVTHPGTGSRKGYSHCYTPGNGGQGGSSTHCYTPGNGKQERGTLCYTPGNREQEGGDYNCYTPGTMVGITLFLPKRHPGG